MLTNKAIISIVALAMVAGVITLQAVGRHQPHPTNHHVPNRVMLFESYKHKHGLTFGVEESQRFKVFCDNLDFITRTNAQNNSYTVGLTPFAHLTQEEFFALYLGYKGDDRSARPSNQVVSADADMTVDWTTKGVVTPIKNQGACGSCWAFSSTGALEGLKGIKMGVLTSMSEQELVDCSQSYGNHGCWGGLMDFAFAYVRDNGIASEADYPYTAETDTCTRQGKPRVFQNKGYTDVQTDSNDALIAAITQQPTSVAIQANTAVFQYYTGGVITSSACGTQLDHGVLAVGYGTDNGVAFIKVKNSWGDQWGLSGYVWIGQADGDGICGINMAASYPTL